jgi:two-component system, NarL family, sensor histidine kinase BarA
MSLILVVDDEQLSRDILLRLLSHYKLDVELAKSGEDALVLATQKAFDFAIVDLAMPQMDGWQLLQKLQTMELPAVALTAFYDPQVAREAKKAGFLACFPKPANTKIIQEIISLMK